MKFSVLLATWGNGCAGSRPMGVSSGRTSRLKYSPAHSRCASVNSVRRIRSTPARAQGWQHTGIEHAILVRNERADVIADPLQQRFRFGQRHPGGWRLFADLLLQPSDSDFEEFIEIAREYAEEAQPLEQRDVGILGHREHAAVERELRQLAVEQHDIGRFHGRATRAQQRPRAGRSEPLDSAVAMLR